MRQEEYNAVTALPGSERLDYAVKRIADWECIWGLHNDDGWVLVGTDEGREAVPVWPHPEFAQACATGAWSNTVATAITLEAWTERWIPGMRKDGTLIAVFPVNGEQNTVIVTPDQMLALLEEELEKYELE